MSRLAMLLSWKRRMDAYTVRLVEAIPERLSSYRASPGQLTCSEVVYHLADCENEMARDIVRNRAIELDNPKLNSDESVTKNGKGLKLVFQFTDTLIESLNESDLDKSIGFPGTDKTVTTEWVIQTMIEHQIHHRGQLITYLRLNDVTVPVRWRD